MSADFVYFRPAKIKDSRKLAKIEHEFFSRFPNYFNAPSPSRKYRLEIGNLVDNNPLYLVAEKRGKIVASIKVEFDDDERIAILGYPIGDVNEPGLPTFQINLIELALTHAKDRGMRTAEVAISSNHEPIQSIFKSSKFRRKKVIVEIWEARLMAGVYELPRGYRIRQVRDSDLVPSWEWITREMDPDSPMAIDFESYHHIFNHQKTSTEGWAVVEKKGEPYAIVSSFLSPSNTAVIFGPFCKKRYKKLRIPLFNEVLWHYSLQGVQRVRVMRTKSFMNDKELFREFGFTMIESQLLFRRNL